MVELERKIKNVLEARNKVYQKDESIKILQKYGIIDKEQRVTPRYQDVVVKRAKPND